MKSGIFVECVMRCVVRVLQLVCIQMYPPIPAAMQDAIIAHFERGGEG